MAISRSDMMRELLPGLNALFGLEYSKYEEEHKMIYETETSDRSFEEEVKLSGLGAAPVKPEGDGIMYDRSQEAWVTRYTHETVALGFAITEEAIEDNLYDSLSARNTKALARGMAHTKQVKAAYPLNNAYSAFTTGDGVSLCNASHPLVSGGTISNMLPVPADLSEAALEDAFINIAAFVDERGLLIAAKPTKLIIPPALQFTATRILESNQRVATADNDVNALRNNGAVPGGYVVCHYLNDPNNWFLLTDVPNGLKYFERVKLSQDMDGDFDTGNVRYKARERYSFGVSDPLAVYGSGLVP